MFDVDLLGILLISPRHKVSVLVHCVAQIMCRLGGTRLNSFNCCKLMI